MRSGTQILPSDAEVYFYDPLARGREAVRLFLDVVMKFCALLLDYLGPEKERREKTGDKKNKDACCCPVALESWKRTRSASSTFS